MNAPPPREAPPSGAGGYPCGLVTLDQDFRILEVNRAICAMMGEPEGALLGATFDTLFTVPARLMLQNYLIPLLVLHGQVEEFATVLRVAAGPSIDVLLFASRSGGAGERRHHVVLAPHRARRRVEDELLRVKQAADTAPGMVFQFHHPPDGNSTFPYTSEAVRALYGCTPAEAEASGRAVLDRIDPGDRVELWRLANVALAAGAPCRAVFRVRSPSGASACHELHATVRRLPDRVLLWCGYVADITERRALEQALAERRDAERSRQDQYQLLSRVSHELRTPLNAILGYAQLLVGAPAALLGDTQRVQVEIIRTAGEQLATLIDEVLQVSRIRAQPFGVELAPTRVSDVLHAALRLAQPSAVAAGVVLHPPLAPTHWVVLGDARRLLQVFGNLLSNAIKYNQPGGEVRVGLSMRGPDVLIEVEDTGIGMDTSQQRSLFQPFNRLGAEATAVAGTGLGLVITAHLVEGMGGRLEVSSARGEGSSFRVLFPRVDAPSAPDVAEAVGAAPTPATTTGRLLYVEDNLVNGALMRAILGLRPGVQLTVVTTAAEGLSSARADPPDALLFDLHLPDMDGIELLGLLRRDPALAHIPAVVVSAAAHESDIQRARAAGFADYWTKPLDLPRTLAAIDALLAPKG